METSGEEPGVQGGAGRGGRWLRPATEKEEYYAVGHQNGYYGQTCYTLTLTSSRPLGEDLLRRALVHLYRKVPVLRLCLGQREGRLWLREMDECVLDLKVVEGVVEEDEVDKLMSCTFNTASGPMWCVRFLPAAGGRGGVLLLCVHHVTGDGFTNVKICSLLHTLLDDLTAGRHIDDDEQIGEHVADEEAQQLYERERQRLLQDSDLYKKRKEELMALANVRPPLLSLLSSPRDGEAKTGLGKLVFDKPTTQAFQKKCKAEGVSLHCGLVGVVNVALLRLLEALPDAPPEYNFVCGHDVGLRRFYQGDTSRTLGVHFTAFSYGMSLITPKDVMERFWPYVQGLHGRLHTALRERAPLQNVAFRLMEKTMEDSFKESFSTTGAQEYSYAMSNIGDVTPLAPGSGDFVQLTHLSRLSKIRSKVVIMCFFVHTFRGQLYATLAYSTRFMAPSTAQQILDLMHESLRTLCQ